MKSQTTPPKQMLRHVELFLGILLSVGDIVNVLRLTIESASAKARNGPPNDEDDDYALPIWAGVIPIRQVFGTPGSDAKLNSGIAIPQSVTDLVKASFSS